MNSNQSHRGNKHTDRQAQRKLIRKSTWIILAGIFIAFLATYFVVKQSPSLKEYYEAKEQTPIKPQISLSAFMKTEGNQYQKLKKPAQNGEEYIFKISSIKSIYVALAKSENNAEPHIVFHSRIPPGENRMFEKAGVKYKYQIKESDKSLRFCVLHAEDRNQLAQRIQLVGSVWSSIPESACLQLR